MQKLTAEFIQRRDTVEARFHTVADDLAAKAADVTTAIEAMNGAIGAYNEILDEAETLRDDVVAAIDEFIDGKSEKWQEGEKGMAYSDWKDEWEGLDFSEIEQVNADDVVPDIESLDDATTLTEAPEAPE